MGPRLAHGRTRAPPMPSVLAQAALEGREGGDLRSVVQILAADPKDRLAAALARLGRAFMARELVSFLGVQLVWRNLSNSRKT